jgi:hypothetical protein
VQFTHLRAIILGVTPKFSCAVVAIAIGLAGRVNAQTATPAAISHTIFTGDEARDAELRGWMAEFAMWQQWWAEFANRPEPGWLTSSRTRRVKPSPPEWLDGRCAEVIDPEDTMAAPCRLFEEWLDDNVTAKLRSSQASAIQKGEDAPHTMWWEHVHVDMLWPATEIRHSVYGVIGLHTATEVKGRLQVFIAPGVMLMNLPALDGRRVWKVATNYGIGWRLFDFNFYGNRRASLHLNIAKSWLISDIEDVFASRSTDFAGFSMSFKRH